MTTYFHKPPYTSNTNTLPNINTVIQGLQGPSLRAHSNANNRVTGFLLCCRSYDQLSEETVLYRLRQTAELGETIRDRHIKRQAILKGFQCGVLNFDPGECHWLPVVTDKYIR